jgi:hypothetical protein
MSDGGLLMKWLMWPVVAAVAIAVCVVLLAGKGDMRRLLRMRPM